MRPLFREFTPLVYQVIQARSFIGAKAGIQHQVMRRYQNIDEIELQQAHLPNRTTKVANIDLAFWPWSIKTLRCKGDAACLLKRDLPDRHSAYTRRKLRGVHCMGKEYTEIDDLLQEWSARQREYGC